MRRKHIPQYSQTFVMPADELPETIVTVNFSYDLTPNMYHAPVVRKAVAKRNRILFESIQNALSEWSGAECEVIS